LANNEVKVPTDAHEEDTVFASDGSKHQKFSITTSMPFKDQLLVKEVLHSCSIRLIETALRIFPGKHYGFGFKLLNAMLSCHAELPVLGCP
jgi:hypothetical protein